MGRDDHQRHKKFVVYGQCFFTEALMRREKMVSEAIDEKGKARWLVDMAIADFLIQGNPESEPRQDVIIGTWWSQPVLGLWKDRE